MPILTNAVGLTCFIYTAVCKVQNDDNTKHKDNNV